MASTAVRANSFAEPGSTSVVDTPPWVEWSGAAPPDVSHAERWDEDSEGWRHWRRHLSRRKRPQLPDALLHGRSPSLLWTLPTGEVHDRTADLVRDLNRLKDKKRGAIRHACDEARSWLDDTSDRPRDISYALECLAWCHALPTLARESGATLWWALLDHLITASRTPVPARPIENPLTDQLLAAELPMALAYTVPELAPCRDLAGASASFLAEVMPGLVDPRGWPHARNLIYLRSLLASWTRTAAMSLDADAAAVGSTVLDHLQHVLRSTLQWTRHDGGQFLTHDDGIDREFASLVRSALSIFGGRRDAAAAASVLQIGSPSKLHGKNRRPAGESEWGELALLRTSWERESAALAVNYSTPALRVELVNDKEPVIEGSWELLLKIDGAIASPTTDWEQVCWTSDSDADYLELEIAYGKNLRVQRHFLLARKDKFLLLADSVLCEGEHHVDYQCIFPLVDGMACVSPADTREAFLVGRRNHLAVMPLRLPEWRRDPRGGQLRSTPTGLSLEQTSRVGSMFAPLFIDLDPDRKHKPLTWRQLTVAQDRQIMPPEIADGFRVQVGDRQWLIYRSLTGRSNRTVLGQNLVTEFIVGRFRRNGTVRPLLEIEAEE